MSVRSLQPQALWNHFEDLNAVPRPSKHEEKVRAFMVNFGKSLGLKTIEDAVGNVIIYKPATKGMEDRETIILQSHLDMVHQKNDGTDFDFNTQGIQTMIEGDWVRARGTTLGADNGIGVAAAMTVLSSKDLEHPDIEALFTIDEESGMTGAKNLDGAAFNGRILLNLDTEDDDEFSVGCAGGIDTNTSWKYSEENVPNNYQAFTLRLTGLKGGHSGMDITLGRGNSNKLLNMVIYQLMQTSDVRICDFEGGGLRNAIPRESFAVVVCPAADGKKIELRFREITSQITADYSVTEPGMKFEIAALTDLPAKMLSKNDHAKIVQVIYATPNGVWRMSEKLAGLPESSSSLARVQIRKGVFVTNSLQRAMSESGLQDIGAAIKLTFDLIGAEVTQGGEYPSWEPNPSSRILGVLKKQYKDLFGEEPKVAACHAGLECGILGERIPGCDMISFGPTIRHPHSPDEKVNIPSVAKFWKFFTSVLKAVPVKQAVC
jgi:dipeptidase D